MLYLIIKKIAVLIVESMEVHPTITEVVQIKLRDDVHLLQCVRK